MPSNHGKSPVSSTIVNPHYWTFLFHATPPRSQHTDYQRQSVSIVANFAALRGKCPVVWLFIPFIGSKLNCIRLASPTRNHEEPKKNPYFMRTNPILPLVVLYCRAFVCHARQLLNSTGASILGNNLLIEYPGGEFATATSGTPGAENYHTIHAINTTLPK
jgi:hypothetical protein